jgi:hypothetical protein
MPPLPTIEDTFRVTAVWNQVSGVSPRNVFHVGCTSGDVTEIGRVIGQSFQDGQWTSVRTGFSIVSMEILPLDGTSGTVTVTDDSWGPHGGSSTGDMVPEAALCVKFGTSLRGPAHRGRIYLGPLGESEIDSGVIQGDVDAVAAAWAAWAEAMITDPLEVVHVVASYKHATRTIVGSYRGDLQQATQRRRLLQTR